jgi:hypothetical protein
VGEKSSLQIALLRLRREGQEVEVVWILQELLCEVRLRFRKRRLNDPLLKSRRAPVSLPFGTCSWPNRRCIWSASGIVHQTTSAAMTVGS